MKKRCAKCRIEKPIEDFHKQPSGKHGVFSYCKPCASEYQRQSKRRNGTPEQRRRWGLYRRYRLRQHEYDALLASQSGMCAICQDPPARHCVDHDHQTGKVRGILCHPCNIKLHALEDAEWHKRAVAYLEATK